jgi:UDP-GlcNAc:undecaprenyl-phosphate/decaprenyl-phosphate GlcNAc-1-phosphate transferase
MTYFLGGVVRRFAARIGAITPIRDRDVHNVPIPRLGGMAIVFGVAAAFLVATNLPFLGLIPEVGRDAWVILAAGAIIALVGAIDDIVDLDQITKLAGQILAAGVVVASGIQLNWIPLPNGEILSLSPSLGAVFSALLIMAVANAVNFVDGLDGLAAGVTCIGASAFCAYTYTMAYIDSNLNRATTPTLLTAAAAGACIGFLPHNFFPARVFMGDSGAYFLGLVLASSTISLTGWLDPGVNDDTSLLPALLPLVLPIAILVLPLIDLAFAIVRRTLAGKSFLDADDQHLHHRLKRMGHSHRRAVIVLYGWAGLAAFGVVVIGLSRSWLSVLIVAIAVVLAVLFTGLLPGRKPEAHPR